MERFFIDFKSNIVFFSLIFVSVCRIACHKKCEVKVRLIITFKSSHLKKYIFFLWSYFCTFVLLKQVIVMVFWSELPCQGMQMQLLVSFGKFMLGEKKYLKNVQTSPQCSRICLHWKSFCVLEITLCLKINNLWIELNSSPKFYWKKIKIKMSRRKLWSWCIWSFFFFSIWGLQLESHTSAFNPNTHTYSHTLHLVSIIETGPCSQVYPLFYSTLRKCQGCSKDRTCRLNMKRGPLDPDNVNGGLHSEDSWNYLKK